MAGVVTDGDGGRALGTDDKLVVVVAGSPSTVRSAVLADVGVSFLVAIAAILTLGAAAAMFYLSTKY